MKTTLLAACAVSWVAAMPRTPSLVVDVSTLSGCHGDGSTDCTTAFRTATAEVATAGGGTVLVPPGRFVTGGFNLSSGTTLEVQGSVVGVMDASEFHYPPIAPLPSYGTGREGEPARYHPLVMCADAAGVRVTGPGVIDGQGAFWWNRKNENERPHLLELYNCSSVEVTGVTLRNSATWTLHPVYSSAIHIHHMSIDAPANSPNTDGIDPDSTEDVLIEFCNISCGDDHIAIKSGMDAAGRAFGRPSRNITVQYCTMWAGRGISIGSEVSGGVSEVRIQHNVLHGPSEHGMHIKTAASRGGYVANVHYLNNTLGNVVGDALLGILTSYGGGGSPPAPSLTQIANVSFEAVSRLSGAPAGPKGAGAFGCFADHPCVNVSFTDVTLDPVEGTAWKCSHMTEVSVENVSPTGLSHACQ